MITALECKFLLRHVAFLTQLKQDSRERSLFPRDGFVSSCHAQHGVCEQSMNSSTKYSIHCWPGSSLDKELFPGDGNQPGLSSTEESTHDYEGRDERATGGVRIPSLIGLHDKTGDGPWRSHVRQYGKSAPAMDVRVRMIGSLSVLG